MVDAALRLLLCAGPHRTERYADCPAASEPRGFFAQLNHILQTVLLDMYDGRSPRPGRLHNAPCLWGYSADVGKGAKLSQLFVTPCRAASGRTTRARADEAAVVLRSSPRYIVTSHLSRLLFTPRPILLARAEAGPPPDVAIHIRRGDKLIFSRQSSFERSIKFWEANRVAARALELLRNVSGKRPLTPHVLIASDDPPFARHVRALLRSIDPTVLVELSLEDRSDPKANGSGGGAKRVTVPRADVDHAQGNLTKPAALTCGEACVPPLLRLIERFSHAKALLVSTTSNMGGFFLTSCKWLAIKPRPAQPTTALTVPRLGLASQMVQ